MKYYSFLQFLTKNYSYQSKRPYNYSNKDGIGYRR